MADSAAVIVSPGDVAGWAGTITAMLFDTSPPTRLIEVGRAARGSLLPAAAEGKPTRSG